MKKILIVVLVLIIHQTGFSQNISKRVLFIGNSYTFYNDMPELVKNCALSVGDTLTTDQNTISGYSWQQHAGDQVTNDKIKQGGFDHVILQANSLEFTYGSDTVSTNTLPYARYLDSLAHRYNPCSQTIFYTTWGRKNGSKGQTYLGQDTLVEQGYKALAQTQRAIVSPVGPVRRYLITHHPEIELYVADASHPSLEGSFVSAVCFYTVIFRKDPTLITFKPAAMSTLNADAIKQAVKLLVYNNLSTWNAGSFDPPQPIADFDFTVNSETTVSFTNLSQHALLYQWKFGDHTNEGSTSPTYIFPSGGTYQVTLTASNCNLKNSLTKTVSVSSVKPVISSVALHPTYVYPADIASVAATIMDKTGVSNANLYWGTSIGNMPHVVAMTADGSLYTAALPAQAANTVIYYKIIATGTDLQTTTSQIFQYTVQDAVVSITPSNITLYRNDQVQFSVAATNAQGNPLTFIPNWTADKGYITSDGKYTAPYTPGTYTVSASQAGVNGKGFAYVTVSPIPVIAGKVEAENFVSMSGIQMEATEDPGGGKNVGYIDANDWLLYDVHVLTTGTYQVEFRIASNVANVQVELLSDVTSLGVLTIPTSTGGWQNWRGFTMHVELKAGNQTLKLLAKTGGFNINWMKFSLVDEPVVTAVLASLAATHTLVESVGPNPFDSSTHITLLEEGTHHIQILNAQGLLISEFITLHKNFEAGDHLIPGIYYVKISHKDKSQTIKFIKQR